MQQPQADASGDKAPVTERRILFLIGAIQFVNILDFVMVMPLGPDFAQALAIPSSTLGLIGGSYTAAAALSGIIGSLFLDRFDRRTALTFAMVGLVLGTAAGGMAIGLRSLVLARVVAGVFGGPATSIALAIIADVVPPQRRGRAMGAVMGSFAVASVLGIPAGLELARLGGWQMPFFAVALLGAIVTTLAVIMMPSMTVHMTRRVEAAAGESQLAFLLRPRAALSLLAMAVLMMGNFAMVPNLSAYLQSNLGYPRAQLGMLYMVGGLVSFATMRVAGAWADRAGSTVVATLGSTIYVVNLFLGFITPLSSFPVMLMFVLFMASSTFRMVPMQALSSRVPDPAERARFMSAQSAVQHMAAAVGAMLASWMLTSAPDGRLIGITHVAWMSASLAATLPLILWFIERAVRAHAQLVAQANPAAPPGLDRGAAS